MTLDEYKEKINEKYGNEYTILSENIPDFKPSSSIIKIRHNTCGYIYEASARNLLSRGMGCRLCAYKRGGELQKGKPKPAKIKKTTEEFKKEVLETIDPDYEVLGEYVKSKDKILMKHKSCGYEYKAIPNNIISKKVGCPHCSKRTASSEEKELLSFIKTLYSGNIIENKRFTNSDGKKYELDIYLPDKKIGFEYNGLYWHSNVKLKEDYSAYHYNKYKFFKDIDITIYQIFEDDWLLRNGIVKNFIKYYITGTVEICEDFQILIEDYYDENKNVKFKFENNALITYIIKGDNMIVLDILGNFDFSAYNEYNILYYIIII